MRIMLVCGWPPPAGPPCGVADATAQLARGLLENGLEVGMVAGESKQTPFRFGDETVGVDAFPIMEAWSFREIPKFLRTIAEWKCDIVHLHYPAQAYGRSWMPYFLPLLLRWKGETVVQTWHEHTRYRFFPNAIPSDTLIVVEPGFRQNVRRRYKWMVERKNVRFIQIASNIPPVELSDQERAGIRADCLRNGSTLVAYFGFVYPEKGLETVFEVADPVQDTVLIVGDMDFKNNDYHRTFLPTIEGPRWKGKVTVTGYVTPVEAARLLAASDVVLLPFARGVRHNNGSFLAATAQGTLVVTTTDGKNGYDVEGNVFYAPLGDTEIMRQALRKYRGRRRKVSSSWFADPGRLARDHIPVYEEALARNRRWMR